MKETENRADKWLELTEQTFDFACYAHKAFLFGDEQTKREILSTITELNCTLKDKKLNIHKAEWLVPIAEQYPALEAKFRAVEPHKMLTIEGRKEVSDLLRPEMRSRRDLNPQPPA